MQNLWKIPSPVHVVHHPVFKKAGITVYIKREDLIHPAVSGNKWRKLKYNFEDVQQRRKSGFFTFGGAFSNHIAAAAYAGHLANLKMVGFIRGHEANANNPTLAFARQCGMEILPISREEYKQKNDPHFLAQLQKQFPDCQIIPEGGSNIYGVRGCMEILPEVIEPFDVVACPVGTATTLAGLFLSANRNKVLMGFPALKGGDYLREDVYNFMVAAKREEWLASTFEPPKLQWQTDYHFGGFGKVNLELIDFMNAFYKETGIPLDPIYTGKMMYGLVEIAAQNRFRPNTTVLAIHTGGLQGIKGMNNRLQNKDYRIAYEEMVAADYPTPGNNVGPNGS